MIRTKFIVGVGWLGFLRGTTRVVDFLKIAFLARILTQSDFGLFAIVTTIVSLLEALTQTGLSFAVIHYKLPIQKVYKTLFVINSLRGILLTLLIFGSAGVISIFYDSEKLQELLVIASLIPFFKGLQNPSTILFYQKLQFDKEFLFRIIPAITGSLISIYFAFTTKSAAGLVYGLVATTFLETIFSYLVAKHNFKSKFDFKLLKNMLGYTKWLTFTSVFSYLINQVDNLFIGKYFNLATLGLYDLAFKLASVTYTELTDIVSRVLFPSLSTFKDNKHKIKTAYLKTTSVLLIPAIIATTVFIIFPESVISIVFGEKWLGASSLLQILAIYGFIRTVNGTVGPLFLTLGKTKLLSTAESANFIILMILIFPFSFLWGVDGVAWAVVVSYVLVQPILLVPLYRFLRS